MDTSLDSVSSDPHARAHRRALRAARAVSLTFAALLTGGCASMVVPLVDTSADAAETDSARPDAPIVTDTPVDHPADAADAGPNCSAMMSDQTAYEACCAAAHWNARQGCFAWGPFVPPAMEG